MPLFGGLTVTAVLFCALVAFVAFIVASTLGVGGPLILTPALLLVLPPAQAVAVIVPVMIFNNLLKIAFFRPHIQTRTMRLAGIGALPAAAIAAFFTSQVEADLLRVGIAFFILAALFLQYRGQHTLHVPANRLPIWGSIAGAISGLTGTAGPVMAVMFKGHGLTKQDFVATAALLQLSLQFIRLPAYVATGIFPPSLWPLASLLSVMAVTAVFVARHLLQQMPTHTFRTLLDLLLLLTALWLIGNIIFT